MLDWLARPADWLLSAGGFVASWFFDENATSFTVVQMMFATVVLAAFVFLIVFWQTLVGYWRSPPSAHSPAHKAQPPDRGEPN